MNICNLIQINETEFRFDIRIRNTTPNPTDTGAIAIANWGVRFMLNPQLNNGYPSSIVARYSFGSELTAGENFPSYSNTRFSVDSNFFQAYAANATWDMPVTLLNHANWVMIGRFKLQCKNGAALRNWLSYAPNIAFSNDAFTYINECSWYDDGYGNGAESILCLDTYNTAVTLNKTLTLPNNADPLASYFFSGYGNWSLASNWNKTAFVANGKNTLPINGSSVSIGGYTTASVPIPNPGICTFDAANISLSALYIRSTSTLTINAGKQLTVTGKITKENPSESALYLKAQLNNNVSTASLKNNTQGITATIELYIPQWYTWTGWHLLSSPVENQAIAPNFIDSTANNYDFYKYAPYFPNIYMTDTFWGAWVNYKTPDFIESSFLRGKAYLVSYAMGRIHKFSGCMNATDVSFDFFYNNQLPLNFNYNTSRWNLIGNPYPCALDADMTSWLKYNVNNTVYVFDGATSTYKYRNGSVGTLYNSEIPAMQGFFVYSTGYAPLLVIPATAKKHSNSSFYKAASLNNQLELNVISPNNTKSTAFISFNENSSDSADMNDALLMPATNPLNTELYSLINDDKYCINALASFTNPVSVDLGFEPKVSGNFSITADNIQSFSNTDAIILHDLKTNTFQNLISNPVYNFSADTVDAVHRFKILFDLASNRINDKKTTQQNIYSFGKYIYIKQLEKILSVSIYTMLGDEIEHFENTVPNILTLNQTGYYIVRVVTTNNVYSQKLYIN